METPTLIKLIFAFLFLSSAATRIKRLRLSFKQFSEYVRKCNEGFGFPATRRSLEMKYLNELNIFWTLFCFGIFFLLLLL